MNFQEKVSRSTPRLEEGCKILCGLLYEGKDHVFAGVNEELQTKYVLGRYQEEE